MATEAPEYWIGCAVRGGETSHAVVASGIMEIPATAECGSFVSVVREAFQINAYSCKRCLRKIAKRGAVWASRVYNNADSPLWGATRRGGSTP